MSEAAPAVTPAGRLAFGLAAVLLAADQALKAWILYGLDLPTRVSTPVLGPLKLTMVWNEGVSFGFLQATHDLARWGLTAFALVVALALAVWASRADRRLLGLALGLIIGGAVGKAIDRARFGAVVDFIDVSAIGFFPWVFNLADSAITIGVILMLADSFRKETPRTPPPEEGAG
ncbi:MAG: signal peptidase II [Phenylobacterium sp.]